MTNVVLTKADIQVRKSSQEVEIDQLLAEEFICDPLFVKRFINVCGIECQDFIVMDTIAEPSLGGEGFGDLLVDGTAGGLRVALLVEDKITAGPATRQAERYAVHAKRLRSQGWDHVWTILVAPASYCGERGAYDASIDLEDVSTIITSPDPVRLSYRRGIIERALTKKSITGVKVPDLILYRLRYDYLLYASEWCAREGIELSFPKIRESYYDGDSWIEPIRHPALSDNVRLRHRLWTSTKDARGLVDLIVSPATVSEQSRLRDCSPVGALVAPFSNGKGIQISLPAPEMRQAGGFDSAAALRALQAMKLLINWFSNERV